MKLNPKTRIGHIHLTVSDLDRSLKFYKDILGFEITSSIGDSAIFLSAGGYHHHIALNTWAGKGATPPDRGHTGLYHFAILYPERIDLAKTLKSLVDNHYPISGVADHGVSESIYIEDPDQNGIELTYDKPKSKWRKNKDGEIEMKTEMLDVKKLLSLLD